MVEVKVDYISIDKNSSTPVVILKQIQGNPIRRLMIWIGESEGHAIKLCLDKTPFPRPMTHDLIKNIIDALSTTVNAVYITKMQESTFYAKLSLKTDTQEIDIDSRPSDAIAIRYNAPIYVDDAIIDENGFLEEEKQDG